MAPKAWLDGRRLRGASLALGIAAGTAALAAGAILELASRGILDDLQVDEWRPACLLWALAMLAGAWLLRRRAAQLEPQSSPLNEPKWRRWLLWTSTGAVAISALGPPVAGAVQAALAPKWPQTASPGAVSATLTLPGMDCSVCAKSIDFVLHKHKGVEKVEFDMQKSQVLLWYDPKQTSKEAVVQTVTADGFPPK